MSGGQSMAQPAAIGCQPPPKRAQTSLELTSNPLRSEMRQPPFSFSRMVALHTEPCTLPASEARSSQYLYCAPEERIMSRVTVATVILPS